MRFTPASTARTSRRLAPRGRAQPRLIVRSGTRSRARAISPATASGGGGAAPLQRRARQAHEGQHDQLLEPEAGDEIEGALLARHPAAVEPADDVRHDRDARRVERLERGRDPLDPEGDVADAAQRVVVADEVHERLVDPGRLQAEGVPPVDEPRVHRDVQPGRGLHPADRRQEALPRQAAVGVAAPADENARVPLAFELPAARDQGLGAVGRDHGGEQAAAAVVAHQLAAAAGERERRVPARDPVQDEHPREEEGDAAALALPADPPGLG